MERKFTIKYALSFRKVFELHVHVEAKYIQNVWIFSYIFIQNSFPMYRRVISSENGHNDLAFLIKAEVYFIMGQLDRSHI